MLTFETYQDDAGEYRWRLRHSNGNVLADSGEGYKNPIDRDSAIAKITSGIVSADYEVKEVDA